MPSRSSTHSRQAVETRIVIIAEVGMNHDGSVDNACRLIDAATTCGADVVKFQTHLADAETMPDAPNPPYFNEESRYQYFTRTAFSLEQWKALKTYAEAKPLRFLSSIFSLEAVGLLEQIGVEAYKIPSGEVTNLPLIERVATTGKPVLLSSGMSNWAELDAAVDAIRHHHQHLTILQCTSEYPCPYERVGLNVLLEMRKRYGLPVGLSDHTMTPYAAFAAVTLGATVVEKHLTLSRGMYGSDARHSLEPSEFAELVRGIRGIEAIMGNPVDKNATGSLETMKRIFEKSIVVTRDLPAGARISEQVIGFKKPRNGLSAARYRDVIGRTIRRAIAANSVLQEADVEWDEAGGINDQRDG